MRIVQLCSTMFMSGVFLLPGLANSQPTVIDFDGFVDNPLGGGEITGDEYASSGVRFSTPDLQLNVFDATGFGTGSEPNFLGADMANNDFAGRLNIEFDAGVEVSDLSFLVANFGGGYQAWAYDVGGSLLRSIMVDADPNFEVHFGGLAVNRVEMTGFFYAIDDVSFTVADLEPGALLENLVTSVVSYNLAAGIGNSLDSKLQNAIDALDRAQNGDEASAIGILYAFIQSVEAQRGKKLTDAQASELVESAQAIIDALDGT